MSISMRLALPTAAAACPVAPLPLRPRARNAGCPIPAPAASALPTTRLRGCASLTLKPQPLSMGAGQPCRPHRGSAAVCHASAYLSPPTMQWVSAAAAAYKCLFYFWTDQVMPNQS